MWKVHRVVPDSPAFAQLVELDSLQSEAGETLPEDHVPAERSCRSRRRESVPGLSPPETIWMLRVSSPPRRAYRPREVGQPLILRDP